MGKYCASLGVLKGPWDQVFAAFWQRYPNPYSKHVLTEDIVHREVTPDHKLLSRRLLTKTNRMPRWAERFFPANVAHSVYILEDSIVDPKNRTMTTFTWNINHARPWLLSLPAHPRSFSPPSFPYLPRRALRAGRSPGCQPVPVPHQRARAATPAAAAGSAAGPAAGP
uniref:PRELI domain containing 1 n=1 Tax=Junco hyemalis TaxID=40217 RepID=A0A8C5IN53_JUNHY